MSAAVTALPLTPSCLAQGHLYIYHSCSTDEHILSLSPSDTQ